MGRRNGNVKGLVMFLILILLLMMWKNGDFNDVVIGWVVMNMISGMI